MSIGRTYALTCPGCGAKLEVSGDLDLFACAYCGANVKLTTSGGAVALQLITGHLAGVRRGTDKTAAELAIVRLRGELAELEAQASALTQERVAADNAYAAEDARLAKLRNSIAIPGTMFFVIWIIYFAMFPGKEALIPAILSTLFTAVTAGFIWWVIRRGVGFQMANLDNDTREARARRATKEAEVVATLATRRAQWTQARSVVDNVD